MEIFLAWLFFSFLVAFAGQNKKAGYGGILLVSLIFSPIIGLIVALVSKDKTQSKSLVCAFCAFEDNTNSAFCPGCGKDAKGFDREHYQKIVNEPEYKEKAYQQEIRNQDQIKAAYQQEGSSKKQVRMTVADREQAEKEKRKKKFRKEMKIFGIVALIFVLLFTIPYIYMKFFQQAGY